jgi:precorrin-6A synthase
VRRMLVIGIGSGDPEHVTIQAVRALNRVDVFFAADKGSEKRELVDLRKLICERYIERPGYRFVEVADPRRDETVASYTSRVEAWHEARVAQYEQVIGRELEDGQCGAFLVWGDPSLYDSTLRIVERLRECGHVQFDYEVIPGISSVQVLAARHKLALNRIGGSVAITTGRKLAAGLAPDAEDLVVMLDGECAFEALKSEPFDIYWGAYLGSDHEILRAGELAQVADEITRVRAEARAQHGWIMDTYLLRRRAR